MDKKLRISAGLESDQTRIAISILLYQLIDYYLLNSRTDMSNANPDKWIQAPNHLGKNS